MTQIRLQYGDYEHPLSEAAVSISRRPEFDDSGNDFAIRNIWSIQGELLGTSQADISTQIQQLEDAYSQQNRNVRLEFEGGQATAHQINVQDTIDGVRVSAGPSYPVGQGAEYANFRTYTIQIEALVKTGKGTSLIFWDEVVGSTGGQPRDILIETLNTIPIRQRVADATTVIVTQTGRAMSNIGWPIAPAPVLPNEAILQQRITRRAPQETFSDGFATRRLWETTWSYVIATAVRVNVRPNFRPRIWPVIPA